MLLYIHVPFCRRKCAYCAFASAPLSSSADLTLYQQGLLTELRQHTHVHGQRVETIFWGGGTPSLLDPSWIKAVLAEIQHVFQVAPDAEISMEANPDSLHDEEKVRALLQAGINRISLGVQALDDAQLLSLGRLHRAAEARQAVAALRRGGCRNLNIDLMWGLPGQTPQQWQETLNAALLLKPDHISAYGLTLEPGTPLEQASPELPGDEAQEAMFEAGVQTLTEAGYEHYEISNFALPGFQCKHNLGYWTGADYLGLGPAATSTIDSARWTNQASLSAWLDQLHGNCPPQETEQLDPHTRMQEMLMLRLRTRAGLSLAAYQKKTGRSFLHDYAAFTKQLCTANLALCTEETFSLTPRGMLLSNSILAELFEETDHIPEPASLLDKEKASV